MGVSRQEAFEHAQRFMQRSAQSTGDTFAGKIALSLTDCCAEAQTMDFAAELTPELKNVWGVTHGGMLATIYDTCMGCTIRGFRLLERVQTVTLNVTYLRAAPVDTTLYLRAKIVHSGRTLATLELTAWLDGQEDRPVGLATGTFFLD